MAVGTVKIDLEANTAKFEKSIQSFEKKVSQSVKSIGDNLKKVGIVAGVAGAGIAALAKSSINAADQMAKVADKIGTTTEELSKLRFAAELTGVSQQTLDTSLQRLTRRLSEASMGTGEAKAALIELGINARALSQLPLGDQMGIIADRMQTLGSQSDRVRIAMKLFDSEGVALVNTLSNGSKGLDEFGEQAEKLGLVVDTQTAKASEKFNDQLTILGKLATGAGNKMATKLLPTLIKITDQFSKWAEEILASDGFIVALSAIDFIIQSIALAVKSVFVAFEGLGIVVNVLAGNIDEANKSGDEFLNTLSNLSKEIKSIGKVDAKLEIKKPVAKDLFGGTGALLNDKGGLVIEPILETKSFEQETKGFLDGLDNTIKNTADIFRNSFGAMEDAIVKMTQTGKFSFKDFANSVIADISRIIVRQALVAPIARAASGFIGGLFSPASAEIGGVSTLGSFNQISGARALGGPVTGGDSFLVGERGPEIFTPQTSGRITPNNAIGKMDAPSRSIPQNNANVNININAVDTQTGTSFLIGNKPTIVGLINEALQTNGTIRANL